MGFQKGDKVWDVRRGYGYVISDNCGDVVYPVVAYFSGQDVYESYTEDGKCYISDDNPLLYFAGTVIIPASEPVRTPKCEFKPFDKVLVRDNNYESWCPTLFGYIHKNNYGDAVYIDTCHENWEQCIPYNEETAHLVGTAENYIK